MAFNSDLYVELSREEKYEKFIEVLEEYLSNETDSIANLANAASLIYFFIEDINWSGFYLLKENQLVLSTFCGLPATTRINIGEGVCGYTAQKKETVVVDNVCEFPGHIACDVRSRSEIVIPIFKNNSLYGVLDIDSGKAARFGKLEKNILEKAVKIIQKNI